MFIRVKTRANNLRSIQICENQRKADKVVQRIVRHVGQAETDEEEKRLRELAQSIIVRLKEQAQPVLPVFNAEDIYGNKSDQEVKALLVDLTHQREEQRVIEGIGHVFGKLFDELKFDTVFQDDIEKVNKETGEIETVVIKKKEEKTNILKACVMARIANPSSKHRTAALLEEDYAIKIPLDRIYRMMDSLYEKQDIVKDIVCISTLSLFKESVDVLFFDVTTLYFESFEKDDLRNNGFSKDCKFKETQVVLALVTTTEGLPISYEVFPGNLFEGNSLITMIGELKKRFDVKNIMLIADRAMFNEENLKHMENEKINYIVAAKLKSLPQTQKKEIFEMGHYEFTNVEETAHWIKELNYKERRIIVSYNKDRANKDSKDRIRLVERLMKKITDKKCNVKDLITNNGTKKYLTVIGKTNVELNSTKIAEDAKWDGLHGVITNMKEKKANEMLAKYKGLWCI